MPHDDDALLKVLGARVRELRRARKLSIEALADEAGIHATHLSAVERGVRNPTVGVLAQVARALDVELSALLSPPTGQRTAKELRAELQRRAARLDAEALSRLLRLMDAAL